MLKLGHMEQSCWCQSPDASCLHSSSNCIWISQCSGFRIKSKMLISNENTLFLPPKKKKKNQDAPAHESGGKRIQHGCLPAELPLLIPWPALAQCNWEVKYIHCGTAREALGECIYCSVKWSSQHLQNQGEKLSWRAGTC